MHLTAEILIGFRRSGSQRCLDGRFGSGSFTMQTGEVVADTGASEVQAFDILLGSQHGFTGRLDAAGGLRNGVPGQSRLFLELATNRGLSLPGIARGLKLASGQNQFLTDFLSPRPLCKLFSCLKGRLGPANEAIPAP